MNILRRLYFSLWYLGQPPWDTNITPPEVKDFITTHPPGKALDLGCGTGTNAITLARNNWQVTGIDFSPNAIYTAKQKARKAQVMVDFRVGDVTKLEGIEGFFDLILDIGCYHSLPLEGMKAYRANVIRLLRVGGSFMLYAFIKERSSDSGSGVTEADLETFSASLMLVSHVDGQDRGARPSAWFTFQKERGEGIG